MIRRVTAGLLVVLAAATACTPPPVRTEEEKIRGRAPEAFSLFGEPLAAPILSDSQRAKFEANLALARRDYEVTPNNADTIIWLGRRTAYLNRFTEAIDIYSLGLDKHPNDARFYRHRGHRLLTTRRIDQAIADFEKAATLVAGQPDQVEPDGLPNARNVPTSTLHFNIWYHLGLAYYLKGDLPNALRAYRECLKVSNNPDALTATSHWLYMTLRRMGDQTAATALLAPITPEMDIIENGSYHKLLLMYKGLEAPEALFQATNQSTEAIDRPTVGYGVGNWYWYSGRKEEAIEVFRQVMATGPWTAFGALAAEADLAREKISAAP
jgi:tetratricopeptide (TPR) repeat protein